MITGDMRGRFQQLLDVLGEARELASMGYDNDALAARLRDQAAWVDECMQLGFAPVDLAELAAPDESGNVHGPHTIKDWEELRHTLGHLYLAIEHLIEGAPESAGRELDAVHSAVFFDSVEEMRTHDKHEPPAAS